MASQSVAVATATVEPIIDDARQVPVALAIMSWSVGVFLYGAAGVCVALRLMLYDFGPDDLTPPYWVSMGALAITVLAGARIVEMADAPMVVATRELIAPEGTSSGPARSCDARSRRMMVWRPPPPTSTPRPETAES